MKIQQGDQYVVPFLIKFGSEVITPTNCSDVKIKINDQIIAYDGGSGQLIYNDKDKTWCFPITQAYSFGYDRSVKVQVSIKFEDNNIVNSPVQQVDVGQSIITEPWEPIPN